MLIQVAVKESAEARLASLDSFAPCESRIAQQLSPTAAAQALGAIGCSYSDGFCKIEISNGDRAKGEAVGHAALHHAEAGVGLPASVDADAVPEDLDDPLLTDTETALQQELHGAGVVVGFRLWQLFRQLLRDEELMKVCE